MSGNVGETPRWRQELFAGRRIETVAVCQICLQPSVSFSENARMNGNWIKTHCKRGHEFTPENTYTPPSRPNERHCRMCMTARLSRRDRRKVEPSG